MDEGDLDSLLEFFGSCNRDAEANVVYGTKFEVADIKYEITIIEKKGMSATKHDKTQLDNLRSRLENIQDKCFHDFREVKLFSHVREFCEKCDKENKFYRHY